MLFENLIKSKIYKKEKVLLSQIHPKTKRDIWEVTANILQQYSFIHSSFKGIGFNYFFTFSMFSSCQCSSEQLCWPATVFSEGVTPNEVLKNCLRKCFKYI